MKLSVLIREALASARSNKVPSALVGILVAAMVAATLATVGRTAAAEQQLVDRLDDAGSRVLAVRETRPSGLLGPTVVAAAAGLDVSERAVGTVHAVDVVQGALGAGGQRVPAWGIVGSISAVAALEEGRLPRPGEALISTAAQHALGLREPFGWVHTAGGTDEYAIVGSFTPRSPFEEYAAGLVYNAGDRDAAALVMVIDDPAHAAAAQAEVLAIVAAADPSLLQVDSPIGVAELRRDVLGDFGKFGRALLLGVLAGGAALTAVVVLADVLVRRADLGRRRALGATRGTIVMLVTLRTLFPAVVGAAMGLGVGAWLAVRQGFTAPPSFSLAVAVLAVLTAACSALPPAAYAATRDPVAVLRTP